MDDFSLTSNYQKDHYIFGYHCRRDPALLSELSRRVQSIGDSYLRATEYLIQMLDVGLNQPPDYNDSGKLMADIYIKSSQHPTIWKTLLFFPHLISLFVPLLRLILTLG